MTRIIKEIKPSVIPMPKLMRAAAYARVSCGKEEMLHSLAAQVSYYSGLIQRRLDLEYIGVYADEALTGTKDNRPEFRRLIDDCRAGRIDYVITKSISRFARNTVTLLETVREFKLLGINVFFEEQNIHTLSAEGELMLTILASYAQEESRSASENCKWRIRKNFEEGKSYGLHTMTGYRIKNNEFSIVLEEAEIVWQIYADYLSGMGVEAIIKKLRTQGVVISKTGVAGILRNEKYIGDLLLQKTFIADHLTKKQMSNSGQLPMYHVEGNHEPLIEKNVFEQVQEEIARRAKKYHPSKEPTVKYPFTGLIACGICGVKYRRKITAAGTKYEKPVWICKTFNSYGKDSCGSQQIPEIVLMQQTAIALGMKEFDETALAARIAEIKVPGANQLLFVFKDGHEVGIAWKTSRRDSWTDAMRKQASADSLRGQRMRGGEHNG